MMAEQSNWIEQLKIMQLNILALFQGIIKERNDYKDGNDFLATTLKQMMGRIDKLERQNEMLRKCNASMRNIFGIGLKTFRKLDLSCSDSIKNNKVSLELLQKLFLESNENIEVNTEVQLSPRGEEKNSENGTIKSVVHEDKIKIKTFGFVNSENDPTLVISGHEAEKDEKGQKLELNSSEEILRNIVGKRSQSTNDVKRKLMSQLDASRTEQVDSAICKLPEPPPQFNGNIPGSPVFKDARKQDGARSEENKSTKSTALKLINEKFVEKSAQLLISPWKNPQQADGSSTSKGQFTPKRRKSDSKFSSPNRSPSIGLRKSTSREDASSSGKKLMQTFLNIESFKQKSPVSSENSKNEEDGNLSKRSRLENIEDDDIIFDSPKRQSQLLEVKVEEGKTENESRWLDETFVSSPAIRQYNLGHNPGVTEIMKNQLVDNRSQEKSPEYDSVPFVYKREVVRKKGERMKLPGHPCAECDKYYKNALGDIDTNDYVKILNKCSRHRDKNPPSLDATPPGYWKPYLTCSTIFSPNKDDAR